MKKILYIGNKLSKHGNTATGIETLGPLLEREGFEIRYASSVKNKVLRLLDMMMTTLRYARWSDYVLIDTYSTSNFWYAFVVSQCCRLMRVSYLPILRGGDLPARLKRNPQLCRTIFKNALVNVAPSGYLQKAFTDSGFDNIVYIPNTIEVNNYTYKKREDVLPKLLWVRSFSPIYNPEMALDVYEKLKTQYPETALCMVGPDKNGCLENIQKIARVRNLDVQFTGKLAKKDWAALSGSFDIFINTTHFDNMPVSVIEAMALGLPVVSTNVGGIPFLLEHNQTALLVNDGDTDAMVEAIKRLMSQQELVGKLAENAALLVANFDFNKVKNKWLDILK